MELIGLLGHQGVGKNYIAENILNDILPKKNTLIMAFADHFKVECVTKKNVPYDKVFKEKDKESRRLLQIVGTEEGRNIYGDDIWINTLETWLNIYKSRGVKRFIISDVRFQNEVDWIKKMGGHIIKVNASDRHENKVCQESNNNTYAKNEISSHVSELEIDTINNFDFEVDNSIGNDVKNQLLNLFKSKLFYK